MGALIVGHEAVSVGVERDGHVRRQGYIQQDRGWGDGCVGGTAYTWLPSFKGRGVGACGPGPGLYLGGAEDSMYVPFPDLTVAVARRQTGRLLFPRPQAEKGRCWAVVPSGPEPEPEAGGESDSTGGWS